MANCMLPEMRDVLPELAADRLTGADLARASAHVAACSECAREVELLRAANRTFTLAVPEIDVARIVAALPKPPSRLASPQVVTRRATRPIAHRAVVKTAPPPAFARRTSWTAWRIAAVATVAVGGLSIAVIGRNFGLGPLDAGHSTAGTRSLPTRQPVQPMATETLPAVIAVATPPDGSQPATQSSTPAEGLAVAGDVSELSDGEIESLLQSMDGVEAEPSAEPDQVAPGISSVVP
jgi:hypothetical protein